MNIKYQKAIEGRSDGDAILKRLEIQDSDKYEKSKLTAIEKTIQLLNEGATLEDAAKVALAEARADKPKTQPDAIATPAQGSNNGAIQKTQSQAIANQNPSPSPETILGPLEDEGRNAANNVIGQIGQYSSEAKSDIEQGLEAFVKGSIYAGAQKTFDSPEWQQAALEAIRGGKSQP